MLYIIRQFSFNFHAVPSYLFIISFISIFLSFYLSVSPNLMMQVSAERDLILKELQEAREEVSSGEKEALKAHVRVKELEGEKAAMLLKLENTVR